MSEVDPSKLIQPAASRVRDPLTGRSIWLAGMVKNVAYAGGALRLTVVFQPGHEVVHQRGIKAAIEQNLGGLGYHGPIEISTVVEAPSAAESKTVPGMSGGGVMPHGGPVHKRPLSGVAHIVVVASGKGGVGKSTVATNLAVGLQLSGFKVGLLDADVHGPSVPTMMNVSVRPMVDDEKRIVPPHSYGVKCLSMGMLVDPGEAMIWRGPMVMGAVRQFLQEARWDGVDYLIIDLPPGTGDAQLTLIQAVPIAGAVIVTTPQEVALADAIRGINMFRKLDVPLLGLVENMAWYELPDGQKDFIFGEGGGARLADRYQTPLLGQIPLRTAIRRGGDQGLPAVLGEGSVATAFKSVASAVAEQLPIGVTA